MSRPLIILGGGGHAAVLIDALQLCQAEILGITDPALPAGSKGPLGIPVLAGDDEIERHDPSHIRLVNGLGSIHLPEARHEIFTRFKQAGYQFETVIHPSAVVARDVSPGEGVQIMAGAVVQTGTTLAPNVILNTRASVDHDCRIGESTHLAPGVTLSGLVTIGARSHIGTGASIIQEIRVGADCLVAAGAVVHRDLADAERYGARSGASTDAQSHA